MASLFAVIVATFLSVSLIHSAKLTLSKLYKTSDLQHKRNSAVQEITSDCTV